MDWKATDVAVLFRCRDALFGSLIRVQVRDRTLGAFELARSKLRSYEDETPIYLGRNSLPELWICLPL